MRSFLWAAPLAAALVVGCMFLPGYDFDDYGAESTATSSGATGGTTTGVGGAGGAGGATSTITVASSTTSSAGAGGGMPTPVEVAHGIPPDTTAFAADDSFVYWITPSAPSPTLAKLVKALEMGGSDPVDVLTERPPSPAIALDGAHFVWIENPLKGTYIDGQIKLSGDPPTTASDVTALNGKEGRGIVIGGGLIYATTTEAIHRSPFKITTDNIAVSRFGFSPRGPLAADVDRVYWLDDSGVLSLSSAGVGTKESTFTHSPTMNYAMTGIGVNNGNVFWTSDDGSLYECPKDQSCSPSGQKPTQVTQAANGASLKGLYVDERKAYMYTKTSVLFIGLPSDTNAVTPQTLMTTPGPIVSLFASSSAVFVAYHAADQSITIWRVDKPT